jgi:glycyl-tRNA synthetase beta chain
VTVANLESTDPQQVRDGNERVIRPRLADAAFFWDNDRRKALATRQEALRDVVYQRGLGSLYDKSSRAAAIAAWIATELEMPAEPVERAAMLCKCDLLSGMVGEFPDLQGTMGRYYATSDGEAPAVAAAIGEHYQPRFAGDALPDTGEGRVLAVADRMDTLAGVFALGKKPSGNRDPFGLRRAALGIIRILIECGLDVDLKTMIANAVELQPATAKAGEGVQDELYGFITDRLRRYFLDRDPDLDAETFDAVMARQPSSLVDFELRLQAVQAFLELDEAGSLAAANKRIANILRQAGASEDAAIRAKLLEDGAEKDLHAALVSAEEAVRPLLEERSYTSALRALAALREPVDRYFDDVMVMVDDEALKKNRLALLGALRALFLDVADISRLSIA